MIRRDRWPSEPPPFDRFAGIPCPVCGSIETEPLEPPFKPHGIAWACHMVCRYCRNRWRAGIPPETQPALW